MARKSSALVRLIATAGVCATLLVETTVWADEPSGDAKVDEPGGDAKVDEPVAAGIEVPTPSAPAAPTDPRISPADSSERAATVIPKAAEPPPAGRATLTADPISDGGIILAAGAFAGLLEFINGTGELRPQQIVSTFKRSDLVRIDRIALSLKLDPNARTYSNIALFGAVGFALLDSALSGVREKSLQTGLVDAFMYVEAVAITWGVTNLAKMAVRRPRPQAYLDAELHRDDPTYLNSGTDSSLSFFSGHASISACISATATYLAFVRAPHTIRPWVTLGVGTAITTFVSIERVRAGAHFPTDVIAGAIAGAGIGMIVPHLHRTDDVTQRRVWVGFAPERGQGGVLQLGGAF